MITRTGPFLSAILFVFFAGISGASAQTEGPALPPTLTPALQELKTELGLTDEQAGQARSVLVKFTGRAVSAVENFGGLSFDSLLDLLGEARSIREFRPALESLLTADQKAKLASLPKSHALYISAMSGWITEARLRKLSTRIGLTEAQVPQVRAALLDQFGEAVEIVEGLVQDGSDQSSRKAILNAVVDLRGVQRQGERAVSRLLTAEQRTALEAYRKESQEASQSKERGDK